MDIQNMRSIGESEEGDTLPQLEVDFREFVPSIRDSMSDYRNKESDYRPSKDSLGIPHPTVAHLPFDSQDSNWKNLETITEASQAKKMIKQRYLENMGTPSQRTITI